MLREVLTELRLIAKCDLTVLAAKNVGVQVRNDLVQTGESVLGSNSASRFRM